jgi:hypothetical protein
MNEAYYLKIGGTEVFSKEIFDDLVSHDDMIKKKAEENIKEHLKEIRVRIGTLLKTDNVSFLLGAGASMTAGGVGLTSIPLKLEKMLHEKFREPGNGHEGEWLSLFYTVSSILFGQTYEIEKRSDALSGDLSQVSEISINLENYLSHLHMWQAGMDEFAEKTTYSLVKDKELVIFKVEINKLIQEITRSLVSLVDLPSTKKENALKDHRRLIKKILTRPLNLRRANLFTREGRKFGLGLVVASQRPSELSKTVLSQCNSFVVHRLQNPEDLRYFREIVPGIYNQLLDQLPALAPRCALVIGECIQAPALVEIREANPIPRSKNPQFYKSWTEEMPLPNVEAVCAKWEGSDVCEDKEPLK